MVDVSINFNSLTIKQKKVYSAIESYIKKNGISPTVREIGELMGEKTPGSVQGILNRLEQKGVIRKQAGMARSIRLVSLEDVMYSNPVYIPEIKKISPRNVGDLFGIYNIKKYHPVSSDFIKTDDGWFIISCPDTSLEGANLKEGDMLLVNTESQLKEDDIVLVLCENRARLVRHKSEDIGTFSDSTTKIIGKLHAKLSKY
jgi:repressor LexA